MKQCIALAGMVCLLGAGCASSSGWIKGDSNHVTVSQRAPRPTIGRNFRKPGPEPAVQLAAFTGGCDNGCGMCDTNCGCTVDGGMGCSQPGCGRAARNLVDGIASGFCGPGGLNPNAGGYPEYPAFNQGPPVGQVAYPYYTVRGPRDFLRDNPPTIGPY